MSAPRSGNRSDSLDDDAEQRFGWGLHGTHAFGHRSQRQVVPNVLFIDNWNASRSRGLYPSRLLRWIHGEFSRVDPLGDSQRRLCWDDHPLDPDDAGQSDLASFGSDHIGVPACDHGRRRDPLHGNWRRSAADDVVERRPDAVQRRLAHGRSRLRRDTVHSSNVRWKRELHASAGTCDHRSARPRCCRAPSTTASPTVRLVSLAS